MSVRIDEVFFQIGTVPADDPPYSGVCRKGDWRYIPITFDTPFPSRDVRVIVTANDVGLGTRQTNVAVAPIAQQVTDEGFVLAVHNSDITQGYAGLNWIAFLETPGTQVEPIDLRFGILQPKPLSVTGKNGDWQNWEVKFSREFPDDEPPVTVATAGNLHVVTHNPAAVPIIQNATYTGFVLAARNSDSAAGACMFYYLSVSQKSSTREDLWLDSGVLDAQNFSPGGRLGDWQHWYVDFREPFLTPPIVLVTANDVKVEIHNVAAVGMAQNVTTHGFTLTARNFDCNGLFDSWGASPEYSLSGQAGFYWVAIGCNRGCG